MGFHVGLRVGFHFLQCRRGVQRILRACICLQTKGFRFSTIKSYRRFTNCPRSSVHLSLNYQSGVRVRPVIYLRVVFGHFSKTMFIIVRRSGTIPIPSLGTYRCLVPIIQVRVQSHGNTVGKLPRCNHVTICAFRHRKGVPTSGFRFIITEQRGSRDTRNNGWFSRAVCFVYSQWCNRARHSSPPLYSLRGQYVSPPQKQFPATQYYGTTNN